MNSICPICLVKIKKNGNVIFKCNHQMHLKCYIECLKNTVIKCPLCKKPVNENKKYYKFLNSKFENVIKSNFAIENLIDYFEKD